jgi:hypothetical protein
VREGGGWDYTDLVVGLDVQFDLLAGEGADFDEHGGGGPFGEIGGGLCCGGSRRLQDRGESLGGLKSTGVWMIEGKDRRYLEYLIAWR